MRRLGLVLLAVLALQAPRGAPALAADTGLIRQALHVVTTRHWNASLDLPAVIRGGATGLRRTLQASGIDAGSLSDVPSGLDPEAAQAALEARLDQAVGLAAGRLSERQLVYGALRGICLAVGGSHTYFITPEERGVEDDVLRGGSYLGLGFVLAYREGRWVIGGVWANSPADRVALRRGDVLLRVADVPVAGLSMYEIRPMLQQPLVRLVVRRGQREVTVAIERGPVSIPIVETRLLAGNIVHLKVNLFALGSARALEEAVREVLELQPRGLIVDLRQNGGGFIAEWAAAAAFLVPAGSVISQTIHRDGGVRTHRVFGPHLTSGLPIAALIDVGTTSAGELMAAALKEHAGALLVGERTGGRLETSVVVGLSDGSALSIAIARTMSGKGTEIEGVGLAPDQVTPHDPDSDRDLQLAVAVQLLLRRAAGPLPVAVGR